MSARSGSNISRISAGLLNRVMDPIVGQSGAPQGTGNSKYAAQLGNEIELGDASALQMSDPAIGTLFGGTYRYVKFRAGDLANTFKRGMVLMLDSAIEGQVTSTEALATAVGIAGIQINPTTGPFAVVPGNFGWIYVGGGRVACQYKAVLTAVAAVGNQLVWAAAGAGADNGTVDNALIATATPAGKYLGLAEVLPVAGAIGTLYMPWVRRRI